MTRVIRGLRSIQSVIVLIIFLKQSFHLEAGHQDCI